MHSPYHDTVGLVFFHHLLKIKDKIHNELNILYILSSTPPRTPPTMEFVRCASLKLQDGTVWRKQSHVIFMA